MFQKVCHDIWLPPMPIPHPSLSSTTHRVLQLRLWRLAAARCAFMERRRVYNLRNLGEKQLTMKIAGYETESPCRYYVSYQETMRFHERCRNDTTAGLDVVILPLINVVTVGGWLCILSDVLCYKLSNERDGMCYSPYMPSAWTQLIYDIHKDTETHKYHAYVLQTSVAKDYRRAHECYSRNPKIVNVVELFLWPKLCSYEALGGDAEQTALVSLLPVFPKEIRSKKFRVSRFWTHKLHAFEMLATSMRCYKLRADRRSECCAGRE